MIGQICFSRLNLCSNKIHPGDQSGGGINKQPKAWVQPRFITEVKLAMQGQCPRFNCQDIHIVAIALMASKRNGPMVGIKM